MSRSVFGWSLPPGCSHIPDELDNMPKFCEEECPDIDRADATGCRCDPDHCPDLAANMHLRSCMVHKVTFHDHASCHMCVADSEAEAYKDAEKYREMYEALDWPGE